MKYSNEVGRANIYDDFKLGKSPLGLHGLYKKYFGVAKVPSKHEALNQCWFDVGPAS